jgi:hypothetical protein
LIDNIFEVKHAKRHFSPDFPGIAEGAQRDGAW